MKTSRTEFVAELNAAKTLQAFASLRENCEYHGSRIKEINEAFLKRFTDYEEMEVSTYNYAYNKIFNCSGDRTNFGKKYSGKKVRVIHGGNKFRGKWRYAIILVKIY